jgi:hypothetical protein
MCSKWYYLLICCTWFTILAVVAQESQHELFPRRDLTRVNYQADQHINAQLFPALSTLTGENYEPTLELLQSGINNSHSSFILHNASRATCRQTLAFALGVWWIETTDLTNNKISFTAQAHVPQGTVSARSVSSTLINHADAEIIINQALKPWLAGDAGISYLPADGLWSAALDDEGHRRFIEILSQFERPRISASSWVSDVDAINMDRLMQHPINAHNWLEFMRQLASSTDCSVALAPGLSLTPFPAQRVVSERMTIKELLSLLPALGIHTAVAHGVIGVAGTPLTMIHGQRQHPAQRRHLALIPLHQIIDQESHVDKIIPVLRDKIIPEWTTKPGWGLWYLKSQRALLIAADIPTQHAILDALQAIDRLGVELGLSALSMSGHTSSP